MLEAATQEELNQWTRCLSNCMRLPLSGWIGFFAVIVSVILPLGSWYWLNTRTWTPLVVPVSLSSGTASAEFDTNLSAWYYANVHFEDFPGSSGSCPTKELCINGRQVHWVLEEDGKPIAEDRRSFYGNYYAQYHVGSLRCRCGHYRLRMEVGPDPEVFGAAQPYLEIFATNGARDDAIQLHKRIVFFSLFLGLTGIILFLRMLAVRGEGETRGGYLPNSPAAGLFGYQRTHLAQWPTRRFVGLPAFGITAFACLLVLFAPYVSIYWMRLEAFCPKGHKVHLIAPNAAVPSIPQDEAVTIRVRGNWDSRDPVVSLNGEPVSLTELSGRLQQILGPRADKTVFVSGDQRLRYRRVVEVIDLLEGCGHPRIVLVTGDLKAPTSLKTTTRMAAEARSKK